MIEKSYDEIFSFENIYKAHLRGRLSKRDKKPLVKFENYMLENLQDITSKLKNRTYKVKGYSSFVVFEPKMREIQNLRYADRVVQHVLCDDVLAPYFTSHAIIDNCVCQIGKGTHFALDRFQNNLQKFSRKHKNNGWVLKCDIKKYFPSIPHKQLCDIVCKHIKDKEVRALIQHIIDSYHTDIKYLEKYNIKPLATGEKTERGIPIGNQTSQIFGMFFLDKVDRLVKEKLRIKIYSRYMDDFVLVHEDKQTVVNALNEIKKLTKSLNLDLNSKTQIFPLKNGVQYLGFRFFITKTGKVVKHVVKRTTKRLRWRVRYLKRAYHDKTATKERIKQTVVAVHGHLSHADCWKLEQEFREKLKGYF